MVRRICLKLIVLLFSIISYSCNNIDIKKEDLVGKYIAKDGAFIELYDDRTFIAKKVNLENIYGDWARNMIIDFEGQWSVEIYGKKIRVDLRSNYTYSDFGVKREYARLGKKISHKIGFNLDILGQGVFENNPPWDLFVWIGDPDDLNKYKFIRQ